MPDLTGQEYHGLTLLEYCGGGAYGDVYYCRDISGREMAVKIVSKRKLGDQWERELRGVSNYRKITEDAPELLRIYHVESDDDSFFYTMEAADSADARRYLPDTLALRLKNGPLPQTEVYRVLAGILSGIQMIHAAGFAHRDIKPDNILFVKGIPKLGDIGLISSLSASVSQLAGTLDFLPPEERAGGSDSSDRETRRRNDLYAFGKVIYCAVTGLAPSEWPSVPAESPLSAPLKYFLHLSFQLCEREPLRRLDSLSDLTREFTRIEHKLQYGETRSERCEAFCKSLLINLKCKSIRSFRFLKKHWLCSLLLVLAAGAAAWYFQPEKPFDITQQRSKEYANATLGLTMTIPFQWEIICSETIQRKLAKKDQSRMSDVERKRLNLVSDLAEIGADIIFCDFGEKFNDNITIQNMSSLSDSLFRLSDDDLRYQIKNMYRGEMGYQTEIYEVKRITVAGTPCIFIDLAHIPDTYRINNYVFLRKDKCFAVAMSAKLSTFAERKAQFESILKTLKIQ